MYLFKFIRISLSFVTCNLELCHSSIQIRSSNESGSAMKHESFKYSHIQVMIIYSVIFPGILELEQRIQREQESAKKLQEDTISDKLNLDIKCSLLQDYKIKTEEHLNEREIEICALRDKLERMRSNFNNEQSRAQCLEDKVKEYKAKLYKYEQELYNKDKIITNMAQEKDTVISTISKELVEERAAREKYQKELEAKATTLYELRQKLEEVRSETKVLERFNTENNEIITAIAQRETCKLIQNFKEEQGGPAFLA